MHNINCRYNNKIVFTDLLYKAFKKYLSDKRCVEFNFILIGFDYISYEFKKC